MRIEEKKLTTYISFSFIYRRVNRIIIIKTKKKEEEEKIF